MYQQKLQGSTVNVSMLNWVLRWGPCLIISQLVEAGVEGRRGAKRSFNRYFGKSRKKTYFDWNYFAAFLDISSSVWDPTDSDPGEKCCFYVIRTFFRLKFLLLTHQGPSKGVKHPYLFFKEKVMLQCFVDFCHRETHPVFSWARPWICCCRPYEPEASQQQAGLGFGKHPGFQG